MQLVWLEKGQSLLPAVYYNKAREAYTRAIALGREDARTLFNCGRDHDERGDSRQALMDLDRAIHLDPTLVAAYCTRGILYANLKGYDDVIDDYHKTLCVHSNLAAAWYDLGITYDELKCYDDAIEAYHQALRLDPNLASAWNNLAIAYVLSGNRKAALDAVRGLSSLDPQGADKLFKLIVPC